MKTVGPNVALRFDKLDKAALVELSRRLQLNQTETVRVLVRESLAILKERESNIPTRTAQDATITPTP